MARLTLNDFRRQFADVVDPADSVVVVYSGIWTFGHRFGLGVDELPRTLLNIMREVLGSGRTLLLPSYTYAYAKTRTYDPATSKPETGILPVTMLEAGSAVRTRSALNSFLASGPRARELTEVRGETLWGDGSLKWRLEKERARMVVLGLPWAAALGFLHRIEEAGHVPYRYFKTFHGVWEEGGRRSPHKETMYVRSLEHRPVPRWALVDEALRARGLLTKSAGEVHMESAGAADIVNAGLEIISDDPYALLANAPDVREWVLREKDREIEALRVEEPAALEYHDHLANTHPG